MKTEEESRAKRYKTFFKNELEAMALYRALADVERDKIRAESFLRLARAEQRHAARWAKMLNYSDTALEPSRPGLRIWALKNAARLLGTRSVVPVLLMGESQDIKAYSREPGAHEIVKDEREHSQTLRMLGGTHKGGVDAIRDESKIWGSSSGSLRAAVLGVNDGLVSNLSLVMGVAGGTDQHSFVLLAGVAGLLAGSFSMGAGEYASMSSQKDIFERQLQMEREELDQFPEEEESELAYFYRAKGFTDAEAIAIAKRVLSNREVAIDTMAREELGMDLRELGSPWGAAITSFISFSMGAFVPLLPYLVVTDRLSFSVSITMSLTALVLVGGVIAWTAAKSFMHGALRMLLAGGSAALVTYGIGKLVGVSIAG